MPVLVTGATGLVGRALCERLLDEGGQVRAYIRRDDAALRAAGVHVAIGAACEVERLEAALTRVHTLVHLVGGWWPERGTTLDALNRETAECAAIAARAAEIRRIVFVSSPGADPGSDNAYLAAKGKAEEHLRASGCEVAVLRSAPVWEGLARTLQRFARGPLLALPRGGSARITPMPLSTLVDAIVAADAREAAVEGTWEVGGPEEVSVAEAAARAGVGGRAVPLGRLSGAPAAVVDLFARDQVAPAGSSP